MANEPRTFKVVFTEGEDCLNVESENHGFCASELIWMLNRKMLDIYSQGIDDGYRFKRVYEDENGRMVEIVECEKEKQDGD